MSQLFRYMQTGMRAEVTDAIERLAASRSITTTTKGDVRQGGESPGVFGFCVPVPESADPLKLFDQRKFACFTFHRDVGEKRMNTTERLLYRPAEAADAMGISRTKVYDLISRGEIPSIRVGGCIRVPIDSLRESIARQLNADSGVQTSALDRGHRKSA